MKKNTKNRTFANQIPKDSSTHQMLTAPTSSARRNGMFHPPKKIVDISADTVITFAYSAMKNIENFIAEYSVWYPAMSSASASGRSKGVRLVSAKPATMKRKNESV